MLKWRLLTAAVLIPPLIAALYWFPPPALAALVALFIVLGGWEWAALCGLRAGGRLGYVGLLALFGSVLVWATLIDSRAGSAVLAFAAAWWVWALLELVRGRGRSLFERRGLRLVAGVLVLIPAWVGVVYLHAGDPMRPAALLYVLVLVWLADSAAFLAGKTLGRTKLAPTISPGKTVEGVIGGVLAVVLLAYFCGKIAWQLEAGMLWAWVGLAAVVALFSVVGDLVESKVKRVAGVKDSGRILPGHGGVLDRIDALTSAVPIFALGWRILFQMAA
jgi:phosphatidate cytidylyltransferase